MLLGCQDQGEVRIGIQDVKTRKGAAKQETSMSSFRGEQCVHQVKVEQSIIGHFNISLINLLCANQNYGVLFKPRILTRFYYYYYNCQAQFQFAVCNFT